VEGVTARCVEIGRRGKVRGSIKADRVVIGRDAHAEDIYGKQVLLRRGAQAENVYGENITIESNCHICGEVQYTGELRMNEHVTLAKEPQKVDAYKPTCYIGQRTAKSRCVQANNFANTCCSYRKEALSILRNRE